MTKWSRSTTGVLPLLWYSRSSERLSVTPPMTMALRPIPAAVIASDTSRRRWSVSRAKLPGSMSKLSVCHVSVAPSLVSAPCGSARTAYTHRFSPTTKKKSDVYAKNLTRLCASHSYI